MQGLLLFLGGVSVGAVVAWAILVSDLRFYRQGWEMTSRRLKRASRGWRQSMDREERLIQGDGVPEEADPADWWKGDGESPAS